ncbi:DUF6090 family protein [uncultured Draconibacterium sp.]|uniref:DUF6090 family protein n=1 Tax=uncultured Draconibacterium sp. TaxID=1573823 RepID=UPI0029C87821|nr:DUF6090 family protein [uncultured Draconibacterium sp.]
MRYKLAAENKVGKYLRYAVGEILLVVIGILIALQVNNWNLEYQAHKNERDLVQNLIIDLKSDTTQINNTIEYNKQKLMYMDSLMQYAGNSINDLKSPNKLYIYLSMSLLNMSAFENQNRTLQKLVSGGINISRPAVTDSISSFLASLEQLNVQSQTYKKAIEATWPSMHKLFKVYSIFDPHYFDYSAQKSTGKVFPPINESIELQDEFFNYLTFARGVTRRYLSEDYLKDHLGKTSRLITFLQTEYDLQP